MDLKFFHGHLLRLITSTDVVDLRFPEYLLHNFILDGSEDFCLAVALNLIDVRGALALKALDRLFLAATFECQFIKASVANQLIAIRALLGQQRAAGADHAFHFQVLGHYQGAG